MQDVVLHSVFFIKGNGGRNHCSSHRNLTYNPIASLTHKIIRHGCGWSIVHAIVSNKNPCIWGAFPKDMGHARISIHVEELPGKPEWFPRLIDKKVQTSIAPPIPLFLEDPIGTATRQP